jgi:cyclopropane-fatty-acyl-phospholipid synthase
MSEVASRDRKTARRLETFRRFLTHISERILPDLGFVLWDGSTVPADLSADALAFMIADEGAVAAMTRRPNIDTFLNLWVTSRFDLRNESFFDLVARRPKALCVPKTSSELMP